MERFYLSALIAFLVTSGVSADAQNWRTPNPNQPNGYRASMASYHYHGSYKEPAQQANGYRATEARSKVGMNCFAPPSTSESGGGGRWSSGNSRWGGETSGFAGGNREQWGANEGQWGSSERAGFQNAQALQNRNEEWNEFYKRRFEATEYGGNNPGDRQASNAPQFVSPQQYANTQQYQNQQQFANAQVAPIAGNFGGYSPGETFGSAQAMRMAVGASAVRKMLRNGNGGNFNQVYNGESGGFNRIYGSQ